MYLHLDVEKGTEKMVSYIGEYFAPSLGVIFACLMNAAPIQSLKGALAAGSLGGLNPTPWAFMFGNCLGWVSYSYLTKDPFVFYANAPGLLLSAWLNISAIKLQYNEEIILFTPLEMEGEDNNNGDGNTTRQHGDTTQDIIVQCSKKETSAMSSFVQPKVLSSTMQERLLYSIALIWLLILSYVGLSQWLPHGQKVNIIGVSSNINLVFFFGAPLSSIAVVLRRRSSEPIHRRTLALNSLNASFWTAYGLAKHDLFISGPNIVGLSLSLFQVLLCVIFPAEMVTVRTEQSIQLNDWSSEPADASPEYHEDI